MKDELLFAMLFFGLRRLPTSLLDATSIELPSPNAGAKPIDTAGLALPLIEVCPSSLLPGTGSPDVRPSLGCSGILVFSPSDRLLLFVSTLYRRGAELREPKDSKESLVPAVAGWGVVARGFGLTIGASDG